MRDGLLTDAMKSRRGGKKAAFSRDSGSGLSGVCDPIRSELQCSRGTTWNASRRRLVLSKCGAVYHGGSEHHRKSHCARGELSQIRHSHGRMADIIDIDTAGSFPERKTIEQNGRRNSRFVIQVASGNSHEGGRQKVGRFIP